jgi:hypothetical protein
MLNSMSVSSKREPIKDYSIFKGSLQLHEREVHGAKAFICPITSCKRNKLGFPRKYNLLDHQKIYHGLRASNHFEKVHQGGSSKSSGGGSMPGLHFDVGSGKEIGRNWRKR